jgi:hypothetical protein
VMTTEVLHASCGHATGKDEGGWGKVWYAAQILFSSWPAVTGLTGHKTQEGPSRLTVRPIRR